jgi:GntR family transcriptional regulator, transcriptional repressor for pyruvate dehydrogenase complex
MPMLKFGPVNRQRLHETIADRLEQMILDGALQPGVALPSEAEMTADLKVSRSVVRDAIRVLATKGLVEIRHGVGTFVTGSGRARLMEAISLSVRRRDYTPWEVFIIRRGLEMVVVEEAIAHATADEIAHMRETLANCRRLDASASETAIQQHVYFHQLMARATRNRVLTDLLDPITVFPIPEDPSDEETQMESRTADLEAYWCGHERILDAVELHDLSAARAAMSEHLVGIERRASRATKRLERAAENNGESNAPPEPERSPQRPAGSA